MGNYNLPEEIELNLKILKGDYPNFSSCVGKILDFVSSEKPVPHKLINQLLSYPFIRGALKLQNQIEYRNSIIKKSLDYFSEQKNYLFNGELKVKILPAYFTGDLIDLTAPKDELKAKKKLEKGSIPSTNDLQLVKKPKVSYANRHYSFKELINSCVVKYIQNEQKGDAFNAKEETIRFFYNEIEYYIKSFNTVKKKVIKLTHYQKSVIATYLTHITGVKVTVSKKITNPILFQVSRHALKKIAPTK